MDIYPLIRAILFNLDPEFAHNITLAGLPIIQRSGILNAFITPRIESPRTIMGLRFPNPVGLAAGLDKNGTCINALGALGFGFIEIGTVTPRPQIGNPRPRLFRLPSAKALINRMGFNNYGVDFAVQRLKNIQFEGVIGVNIGKNRDTTLEDAVNDYLFCLQRIYPYAGYIAINISSPNTPNLRLLQSGAALTKILTALKKEQTILTHRYNRYVPLVIKIAPDLESDEIGTIAELVRLLEIDGIIATNTTIARDAVAHLPYGAEEGGLSGIPLAARSTKIIKELHSLLGDTVTIIGSGGIFTKEDAIAKQSAGAALIQIYTGLIYQGPHLISEITRALD